MYEKKSSSRCVCVTRSGSRTSDSIYNIYANVSVFRLLGICCNINTPAHFGSTHTYYSIYVCLYMMHCIYDRSLYIPYCTCVFNAEENIPLEQLPIVYIYTSLFCQHSTSLYVYTTLTLSLYINVGIGNGIFTRTIGTTTHLLHIPVYSKVYIYNSYMRIYTYIIYIYMATHSAQKLTSKSCFPVQNLRQKSMYLCLDTMWIAWKYISSYKRLYNKVYFIGGQCIYGMYRCIYSIHMFGIGILYMDIYDLTHMHACCLQCSCVADNSMRSDSCSSQMKSHDPV